MGLQIEIGEGGHGSGVDEKHTVKYWQPRSNDSQLHSKLHTTFDLIYILSIVGNHMTMVEWYPNGVLNETENQIFVVLLTN